MILKTLTHDHGDSDVWNWYDNIESASAYYDEASGESVVSVRFKDATADVVLVINEVAYLCNDDGKTIEKLRPSDKFKLNVECDITYRIRQDEKGRLFNEME